MVSLSVAMALLSDVMVSLSETMVPLSEAMVTLSVALGYIEPCRQDRRCYSRVRYIDLNSDIRPYIDLANFMDAMKQRCQSSGNFAQTVLYNSIGKEKFSGNFLRFQDFLMMLTGISG